MSRRPRRVLVTGGQGFVGRHLVGDWLAADPDVRIIAIGRSPRRTTTFSHTVTWLGETVPAPLPRPLRDLDPARYTYAAVDLLDGERLTRLLVDEDVDTIVHLAGSLRDEPFDVLVRNNIGGVQALLEATTAAGRDGLRVVLGSSGSVYGAVAEADLPISEGLVPQPIDLYSVTKRTAEELGSLRRRGFGLDVAVARIFNVIGPGEDERHLTPSLARQFAERAAGLTDEAVQVGPLDTSRDFIDVRDVARALRTIASADVHAAADADADGGPGADLFNVASGVETPIGAIFDDLAALAGVAASRAATRPARRLDMVRQCADVRRLSALGFAAAHPLADSLATMLGYYRQEVAGAVDAVK